MRRTSRRRLLAWGGAALAAVGTTATAVLLSGEESGGTARVGGRPEPRPPIGALVWSRDIGEVEYGGALLRSGKGLYVLDDRGVVRLDAETNTVRWTYPEKDLRGIQARGELVYVLRDSLFEPELMALRVVDGREVWTSGVLSRHPHRPLRPLDAVATGLEGGQGMFTVSDDVTCLFTYAPRSTEWKRRTASGTPWRAYAFDSRTGKELWFHTGAAHGESAQGMAGGRGSHMARCRRQGVVRRGRRLVPAGGQRALTTWPARRSGRGPLTSAVRRGMGGVVAGATCRRTRIPP
ncbi:PQQ-binding-like beta-propeller repeat protein [Streptomyces globisporus]|uniref:outer membrane protein assembly factor BamB family protein n=1 Tax=Streptomyces globisporus TaxID=1908 RepID=UPI0036A2BC49